MSPCLNLSRHKKVCWNKNYDVYHAFESFLTQISSAWQEQCLHSAWMAEFRIRFWKPFQIKANTSQGMWKKECTLTKHVMLFTVFRANLCEFEARKYREVKKGHSRVHRTSWDKAIKHAQLLEHVTVMSHCLSLWNSWDHQQGEEFCGTIYALCLKLWLSAEYIIRSNVAKAEVQFQLSCITVMHFNL